MHKRERIAFIRQATTAPIVGGLVYACCALAFGIATQPSIIAAVLLAAFCLFALAMYDGQEAEADRARLLVKGDIAVACVTAVSRVGTSLETMRDQVAIRVTAQWHPAIQTSVTLPIEMRDRLRPGAWLAARIDPLDPSHVIVQTRASSEAFEALPT